MNWSPFSGILANLWYIGRAATGIALKNSTGVAEIRNTADDAYAKFRALEIQSTNGINDVPVLRDLQARIADIVYSFDGASPPAGGTNSNQFGFCHTTGGSYTQGDVVYDTGSALVKVPTAVVKMITTRTSITGGISLNANGVYVNQSGTWTLKGDGGATDTGKVKCIAVSYDYEDTTVDSTTTVPDGATVTRVVNRVTTPFSGGTSPTLHIQINGSTPETVMATTDSMLDLASGPHQFENQNCIDIDSDSTGVVRLTVTPDGSTAGAGKAYVFYVTPGA